MADGMSPRKSMASGQGFGGGQATGGTFGVAPMSSHRGREHPERGGPTLAAALADSARGHPGHDARSALTSMPADVNHGPMGYFGSGQGKG